MIKSLIVLLFLTGCGTVVDERYAPPFDKVNFGEFEEYVDDFKTILALNNLSVKYKTLVSIGWVAQSKDDKFIGRCYFYPDYRKTSSSWITISENLRDSPNRLRWTVYHELGHCLMDLDHSENQSSLMYFAVPGEIDTKIMNDGIINMVQEIKENP